MCQWGGQGKITLLEFEYQNDDQGGGQGKIIKMRRVKMRMNDVVCTGVRGLLLF